MQIDLVHVASNNLVTYLYLRCLSGAFFALQEDYLIGLQHLSGVLCCLHCCIVMNYHSSINPCSQGVQLLYFWSFGGLFEAYKEVHDIIKG